MMIELAFFCGDLVVEIAWKIQGKRMVIAVKFVSKK